MSPLTQSLSIFGVMMITALIGTVARRILPDHHLSEGTRTHFAAAISIVATLTALVLGLAFSTASTSRTTMIQNVLGLASDIVQLDNILYHYGPQADPARATLAQYASAKLTDVFPENSGAAVNLANPATAALLEQTQDQIVTLQPVSDPQRWRQSQALTLTTQIVAARWNIEEQSQVTVPRAGVIILAFWLAILFGTYGLFMPVHATAGAGLALSGLAVTGAILMILEAHTPFTGLVRIPSAPLAAAVQALHR